MTVWRIATSGSKQNSQNLDLHRCDFQPAKKREKERKREGEGERGDSLHRRIWTLASRRHEVRRASPRDIPSCHDAWRRDVAAQRKLSVPRIVERASACRISSRILSFVLFFHFFWCRSVTWSSAHMRSRHVTTNGKLGKWRVDHSMRSPATGSGKREPVFFLGLW